jgi:PAS domain S-box-containing protein
MGTQTDHDRIEAEIDRKGLSTDPFAAAVRATRMPMVITDPHLPDNPIVFVNDAFSVLTGYAREEILGRNCRFLQGPETDPSDVYKIHDAIARREPLEIELKNYKSNGEVFWNRLLVSPIFDDSGELTYFFASQFDVSVERLAERHLRDLNEKLEERATKAMVEHERMWLVSPDLLLLIDFDGVFRRVNPAWHTALGYAPEDLIGHHVNEFVLSEDHASTIRAYEVAAAGGLPVIVNRYRHKDGEVRWISWTAAPADGMTFATGRDVTAEKKRQAELETAQEQLRQSQKLEAIGQLTGGVAHDFNNLLTVIRGSVDLLRRDDLSDVKRARYVDAIGDTADRAAKLTGQLLAFARRQALSADLFDAGASLNEVTGMLQTMTGSRIKLELHIPAEPYFIVADRSQFDTAVVNIGINARDAMNGEGRLTISTGPVSGIPKIRGHAAIAGDFIAVTITDAGVGIAPDLLDRIFEPFYTTKGVGQGTGLGLSQVIGFAKQSGGDVHVDSVPDKGTTFTLYLPRAYPNEATEPQDVDDFDCLDGNGTRVLVVEDNEDVGKFATAALEELGYETVLATGAQAALAALESGQGRFHVVFSDVVMPGMSGVELGQEVRRLYPDVSVILTSGYSHVLAQNGRHGFELLHKPYSIEQLSRVLRKAMVWQSARRT